MVSQLRSYDYKFFVKNVIFFFFIKISCKKKVHKDIVHLRAKQRDVKFQKMVGKIDEEMSTFQ